MHANFDPPRSKIQVGPPKPVADFETNSNFRLTRNFEAMPKFRPMPRHF